MTEPRPAMPRTGRLSIPKRRKPRSGRSTTPKHAQGHTEPETWKVGQPVRVASANVANRYKRRTGWVGAVVTQRFPDGRQYTEIGVTWSLHTDWAKASADTWFRVDELEAR